MIAKAFQYLFAPRLYKIYKDGSKESLYTPLGLEKWGDKVISTAQTICSIGLYASPILCMYILKRGLLTIEETRTLSRYFGGISLILVASIILRGIGRALNPKFQAFVATLNASPVDSKVYMKGIRQYDFDFGSWPVNYAVPKVQRVSPLLRPLPFSVCANSHLPIVHRTLVQLLAYLATHSFGLRLIYPGSLGIIHIMFAPALIQGRTVLVEDYKGQRAKIQTSDGNAIDVMFVDKRSIGPKGNTLVICCEGNSGFYEIGIMMTPIRAGYSALSWNHPGFATSTGKPYPLQEQNAIDAVMQFAINELDYQPENIILFGWSIGGFTATFAAVAYPDIKGLILDATFDDLLPLAQQHMPKSWKILVIEVIRSYVNLNVGDLISKYSGPVKLIRRTEDEIICLRPGQLSSNRANDLLLKMLLFRHPQSLTNVEELRSFINLLDSQRPDHLREFVDVTTDTLKLVNMYMKDYKSTHCSPLPEETFDSVVQDIEKYKSSDWTVINKS